MKGKRCIGGGRTHIRPVLYMSALSATRSNPILSAFYKALKKRNEPGKVALTAVMRKLRVHMNSKLKVLVAKAPPFAEAKIVTKSKSAKNPLRINTDAWADWRNLLKVHRSTDQANKSEMTLPGRT